MDNQQNRNFYDYNSLSPAEQADHDRSVRDYPDIQFSPTEFVVIDVERSWTGLAQIWLLSLLAFLALVGITYLVAQTAPNDTKEGIALIGFAAALGSFVGGAIATYVFKANYFIVTSERFFARIQNSPFNQQSQNIEIENVENCVYSQEGILQTFLNYGSISFSTIGRENTYLFKFVTSPEEQFKVINNVIHTVDRTPPTRYRLPDDQNS